MEERFGDKFSKAIKNKEKPSREEIEVHAVYAEKCKQAMAEITRAHMLLPDKEFRKSINEAFGGHLLPRPWGSRSKDEMSVWEKARYGGSFTLAVDGNWYTGEDGDALDGMELMAVEVKAAAAFGNAEDACISLYEEGSRVSLSVFCRGGWPAPATAWLRTWVVNISVVVPPSATCCTSVDAKGASSTWMRSFSTGVIRK